MKTPNRKEFCLRRMKLKENGAKGIDTNWAYLWDIDGLQPINRVGLESDLVPHNDLINLMKELRSIVAKVENIDYARNILTVPGFEPTDTQQLITEAGVQEALQQIEITGISLSTKKDAEGVIITYKKFDNQERCKGTSTSWINMEIIEYGIEEELKDIIDNLKIEAYRYVYEYKHADYGQMTIPIPSDIVEEAEVIEE